MTSNVWQWVEDCYHDNYNGAPTNGSAWTSGNCGRRVVRAGSWVWGPQNVRAAYRLGDTPDTWAPLLGFRVGRTLSP